MIARLLIDRINDRLDDDKVLIITGPRQVGKTTLLKTLFPAGDKALWWNGDEPDIREFLSAASSSSLRSAIGQRKTVIIDEAQRVENIGLCLKLIKDNISGVKVIVSGSSSIELSSRINEPLTGRKWEFNLFPISHDELRKHHGEREEKRLLEKRLIFGQYPDVINHPGDEPEMLAQLSDSILYKDILTWERVQKPAQLERLVQAIAFQVGQLVSYNELGQIAGLDNQTVEHYISLLEKSYVLFRLGPLSRNLRNELKKTRKIYFFDNGIRNAVIRQFNSLNLRNDQGALWENYIVSERLKHTHYQRILCNRFFWRNHAQQEIDYVEERNGAFHITEIKWSQRPKQKFPKAFLSSYEVGEQQVITKENFTPFISTP